MKNFRLNKNSAFYFILFLSVIFFTSCASYTKNLPTTEKSIATFTPYYVENFTEESFKISIEAFGNHFGGILVAKKITKNHFRFVIMNEFGGKLMDFELIHQKLTLNYAIDQLDRKIILKLLEKDFALLFTGNYQIEKEYQLAHSKLLETDQSIKNKKIYLETSDGHKRLINILLANNKERAKISFLNDLQPFPEVEITHGKFPIKIFLHLLSDQIPSEL